MLFALLLGLATGGLALTPSLPIRAATPSPQSRVASAPSVMAAGRGRRAALLTAATALASTATGASADTIEDIAARSNAQAAEYAAAKAQAKKDKEAADGIINVAASAVLLGLGGFAAYTAVSYIGDSNTRYSNFDDQGNERGYQALSKGEALIQARPSDAPKKAVAKKVAVKKAPAKPAFELPNFGEFGAKPKPAAKKAPPKAKAAPAAPAFKFPWD